MSAFDVNYTFQRGYEAALNERKGKGWERDLYGEGGMRFICKDCLRELPLGFRMAPNFCPFCGKQHVDFFVKREDCNCK